MNMLKFVQPQNELNLNMLSNLVITLTTTPIQKIIK